MPSEATLICLECSRFYNYTVHWTFHVVSFMLFNYSGQHSKTNWTSTLKAPTILIIHFRFGYIVENLMSEWAVGGKLIANQYCQTWCIWISKCSWVFIHCLFCQSLCHPFDKIFLFSAGKSWVHAFHKDMLREICQN